MSAAPRPSGPQGGALGGWVGGAPGAAGPVRAAQAGGRVTGNREGNRSAAPPGAAGARPWEGGARGSMKSCRFLGKLAAAAEPGATGRDGPRLRAGAGVGAAVWKGGVQPRSIPAAKGLMIWFAETWVPSKGGDGLLHPCPAPNQLRTSLVSGQAQWG